MYSDKICNESRFPLGKYKFSHREQVATVKRKHNLIQRKCVAVCSLKTPDIKDTLSGVFTKIFRLISLCLLEDTVMKNVMFSTVISLLQIKTMVLTNH